MGEDNSEWVVENAALLAIERAKAQRNDQGNLAWGKFMQQSVGAKLAGSVAAKPKSTTKAKSAKPAIKSKSVAKATPATKAAKASKPASKPKTTTRKTTKKK